MITLALHLLLAVNWANAAEPEARDPLWGTFSFTDDIVGIAYGDHSKVPNNKCAVSFQVRPPVGSNSAVYSVVESALTPDTHGSEVFTVPQGVATSGVAKFGQSESFKSWVYLEEDIEVADMFFILLEEGALAVDITVSGKKLPTVKVENPKETRGSKRHVCTITFI